MVSSGLIYRCLAAVVELGTAIPVVDCKDSVRIISEDGNEALERSSIKLVQTPQAFHGKIILPAFNIDYKDKFTDEASVVEAFGLKVTLVEGEEENIKITKPADLIIAESILSAKVE
jgi:2-C-methyl-D-erythritol 4-phosphate cytidylyltransferase